MTNAEEELINKRIEEIKNFYNKSPDSEAEHRSLREKEAKRQNREYWDYYKEDPIDYFDTGKSYEITGYKPIDMTHGLDFEIEPFLSARRTKESTGEYCSAPMGTKLFNDFWNQEYERCRNGMTVNGYTITGDNYFFINYYQLKLVNSGVKAGSGRGYGFAEFYVCQYEYFHYLELCRVLKKNAIGLKSRYMGFSEIGSCIIFNTYNCRASSRGIVTAQQEGYVTATLEKAWRQMDYCNTETNNGFKKLRQKLNSSMSRRASVLTGNDETGWMSEITGIVADKPNKIRGDRTDILIMEEFGSWPNSKKAFIQAEALCSGNGDKFGIILGWGTGGDSGSALAGLSDIFLHPVANNVLPFRHNYTASGDYVVTGFFIPSYKMVSKFKDNRGWCDPTKGREHYEKERQIRAIDPNGLMIYCAEYCFTPEEALAMEGENQFNKALLSEQLTQIKIHHVVSPYGEIDNGVLDYERGTNKVKFIRDPLGKVHILEHPKSDESGNAYRNLYVAGIDSIDIGMSETSINTDDPSQFCIVVKKRAFGMEPPTYVAFYKDRPNNINEAYKQALCLLQYYNCKAVLESTKVSLLTWMRSKGAASLYLMKRPRACLPDVDRGRSNLYGAQASPAVIQHGLDLIENYINDYSQEIWFIEMLEDFISYSYENKRKFDIVAACQMCELGDEELTGVTAKSTDIKVKKLPMLGYYTDEYGKKQYGVIPDRDIHETKWDDDDINTNNVYKGVRSSDPRDYRN